MKPNFIRKETPNDGLTPVSCFKAIGGLGCCMLESAYDGEQGKSSLIGLNPIGTFQVVGRNIEIEFKGERSTFTADPYEALTKFSKDRRAFGFIGYDAVRLKEVLPDRHPSRDVPDFFFHLYQTIIEFDHSRQRLICTHEGTQEELDAILTRCFEPIALQPLKTAKNIAIEPDLSRETFSALVERAKEYIRAGDIFQVVLSRSFRTQIKASPFDVYRALRQTSPAPFLFFFNEENFAIAGASPELLISAIDGKVESMPIAGTSPKGQPVEALLSDPKECAEHVMLVDLARNDAGVVSVPGSVRVSEFKVVKTFSHVNHIVSRVVGDLSPAFSSLDAFRASFPAGTLSGAPKIRAMEIIDELESSKRHLYGGAVVTIDERGNLKSCIAIRMAFIRGSEVELRVGAGIVLDSDGLVEAQETEHKARGVIEALQLAEGGI